MCYIAWLKRNRSSSSIQTVMKFSSAFVPSSRDGHVNTDCCAMLGNENGYLIVHVTEYFPESRSCTEKYVAATQAAFRQTRPPSVDVTQPSSESSPAPSSGPRAEFRTSNRHPFPPSHPSPHHPPGSLETGTPTSPPASSRP